MGREIMKVSFKSAGTAGVKIIYNNFDNEGPLGDTTKNYKHVPHETFVEAMQKLKPHLLIIAQFVETSKLPKVEEIDGDNSFRVCGFTVSGSGEKEGVILTGYRTLKTGLGYVFNTPLTKVDNEGDSKYKFIAELMNDIDEVKAEAEEYLKGKHGVKKQAELFEEEPANQE